MKGDFTRFTFRPEKHFSSVRLQQGRVLLDAEWNEQMEIESHVDQTTTADIIGDCGAPIHDAGFSLPVQTNDVWTQQIGAGRYYVDGILCENESNVAFTQQPDLPGATLPTDAGTYLAYLDVWQRHLTALERPELREVALGGPDSATRTKTIWQVKLVRVDDNSTCARFTEDWIPPDAQSTGRLRAQHEQIVQSTNECLVPPGAGYRRLENQLYRVEIHTPGPATTATYKWSRDNGSIVTNLLAINGNVITISDPGKDSVLTFANAKFIELSGERRTLLAGSQPNDRGVLLEVDVVQGNTITVKGWPGGTQLSMADFGTLPTVRRWDGAATVTVGQMLDLEDGVQVEFATGGVFRTGDYWTIPARTLTGKVEWPRNNAGAIFEFRHGIKHHYCPLGLLRLTVATAGATWTRLSDCRELFPPITELTSLFYVSGDGQEAMPHSPALPKPLQVGVANGKHPVRNAIVRFRVTAGTGALTAGTASGNTLNVLTNNNGIAECNWTLDATNQSQQVEAALADGSHLPVRFNANLSRATAVAYTPTSQCPDLVTANVRTVQEALDRLCQSIGREPGIHIKEVAFLSPASLLRNDTDVAVDRLLKGIRISCDTDLFQDSVRNKPVCFITLEMPFPFNAADRQLWGSDAVIGFQPLILAAQVNADNNDIFWIPIPETQAWLQQRLFIMMREFKRGERVLARLTVKGNFIWAAEDKPNDPKLYLDGEAYGFRQPGATNTDVRFDGDGRRGGDLEMWFWLTPPSATFKVSGVRILSSFANPANPALLATLTDPRTVLIVPQPPNSPASMIEVQFTAPVDTGSIASGRNFLVVNAATGAAMQGTLSFVNTSTVRLFLPNGIPIGRYQVTLRGTGDAITSQGAALDGEPVALPSGNNEPGGDFSFTMSVGSTA